MKNVKKLLGVFVVMVCALFLVPNNVDALENHEDLIKKIAPDGENAVFKIRKPNSIEEGDMLINGYVNNLLQEDGYEIYAGCYEAPYTSCTVSIRTDDYESTWENGKEVVLSGWKGSYTINVTYDEPKSNSVLNDYFGKLNNFSESNPNTYYFVEDLSLINYYLTSEKSELWNPGAPGRALKFSTLNNVTNGANITYYIDVRAGIQDENLMYESAFGPMSIFYNGYSYGTKTEGLYLKRVIYIPQDTEDTKESYIAAAQKRINDYLGNSTSAVVSYGGLLSSLPEGSEDEEYPIKSDGNYYNIKIGSRTYKFYIVKASSDKLVEPTYLGTDIDSKIQITSENSTIPLDTSLTVKNVKDSSIKDKIGTENYKSYDISLYSDAKGAKIEKLENGKFIVKIPVPTELNGKELVVYYITTTGEKEEHEVTIKDGYAVFTTDHFSTYTLAEKVSSTKQPIIIEKDETPKTGTIDIISYVLVITLISVAGIIVLKKKI